MCKYLQPRDDDHDGDAREDVAGVAVVVDEIPPQHHLMVDTGREGGMDREGGRGRK